MSEPASLAKLLKELVRIEGVKRIRLFYLYPTYFDDELLQIILTEPKICKYVDIPLQHISNNVLKRMNRPNNAQEIYLKELGSESPMLVRLIMKSIHKQNKRILQP